MPAMTLNRAMRAERWHALTLGIPGMSPGADASRLRTALLLEREFRAYSNGFYARATNSLDPDPRLPFCLHRLITERGNIQRIVDAPDFAGEVLDHMDRGYREELVSDDDGSRWESFVPAVDDYRAAARETAHIRAQLHGLIAPRPRGHAVTYGFLPPRYKPPTDPGVEPPF